MGDYYQGYLVFVVEGEEQFQYFFCGVCVEVVGWFVGEDQCWFVDQCVGDGDVLLLVVGKVCWMMVGVFGQVDLGEYCFGLFQCFVVWYFLIVQGQCDVVYCVQLW